MTSATPLNGTADGPRGGGRRMIVGLAIFAVLSFVGGVLLAVFDPAEVAVPSYEADTFSRSAVGHRGLVRWLRAMEVPVVVSRAATGSKAGPGTVLAILEPPLEDDEGRLARLVERSRPDAILLALPKWSGRQHRQTDGWIARLEPVGHAPRDHILARLGIDARSVPAGQGAWSWHGDSPSVVPALTDALAIEGAIEPLLARGGQTVIGRVERNGIPVIIVADPDLLANAGLVHHAPLLVDLLQPLLTGRALVVDETLHGYLTTASLTRQLFEFPLAALTIQALAMIALALLAGVRRFGAPQPAGRARGGRRVLIENTAALGQYAGHDDDALRRYWQAAMTGVARGLNAPAGLGQAEMLRWLTRIGEARRVVDGPAALAEAAESAPAAERLATARRIHRWRRAMLADAHADRRT